MLHPQGSLFAHSFVNINFFNSGLIHFTPHPASMSQRKLSYMCVISWLKADPQGTGDHQVYEEMQAQLNSVNQKPLIYELVITGGSSALKRSSPAQAADAKFLPGLTSLCCAIKDKASLRSLRSPCILQDSLQFHSLYWVTSDIYNYNWRCNFQLW